MSKPGTFYFVTQYNTIINNIYQLLDVVLAVDQI